MDIHELKQFESVYQPSKEIAFCWLRKQYVQLSTEENHAEVVDHANDSLRIWQAAKAQAVQSKQDLIDRVNARWQLAHEQCAENWNTYSSAQMDAFDWVEQDIEEFLGEAQEPAND